MKTLTRTKAAELLKRSTDRYGHAIITTVCIAVITATALFTKQSELIAPPAPTPPVSSDISAAQLIQDSLTTVQKPATAAPTQKVWHAPLDRMIVTQEFDDQKLSCLNSHGIWQIHNGIDLMASPGERVYAIGNGIVTNIDISDFQSVSIEIEHDDALTSTYIGLASVSAMKEGDIVHSGQTIGFAGGTVFNEDLHDCHIHFTLERDRVPIDPMLLLSDI